ncbi:hypothetical protein D3C73_1369700 [compost metagenome]
MPDVLARKKHTREVDVEDLPPLLQGGFFRRLVPRVDARVVHQNVDLAVRFMH